MGEENICTGTLYLNGVEVAEIKETKEIKIIPIKKSNKKSFEFNKTFTGNIKIEQTTELKRFIKESLILLEIQRLSKILNKTKKYRIKKKLEKRILKVLKLKKLDAKEPQIKWF
ncbi:hypothetical protein [Clostridium senegalense]